MDGPILTLSLRYLYSLRILVIVNAVIVEPFLDFSLSWLGERKYRGNGAPQVLNLPLPPLDWNGPSPRFV